MDTKSIELKWVLHVPTAQAFRAFTNATILRRWLCDIATVDPKPGGRFYAAWNSGYYTSGEYTAVEAEKLVEFTWLGRSEPAITQVRVQLEPDETGTKLTLIQTGIQDSGDGHDMSVAFQTEWQNMLENLASVLETGADLRITRRPMVGIYLGDFNAEQAKRLNISVTEGARLDGVLEGMGAQKAGLQKDDVIVAVNGQPIRQGGDSFQILSTFQAGDTVEIEFYRGPEKKTVEMILSARPLPEIPASAHELAQAVQKVISTAMQPLQDLLNNATEEQASRCPQPGEWSTKLVLAHLIHEARGNQDWINEIIFAQEPVADDYGDNMLARVEATAAVYGSAAALLNELQCNQAEIVGLLDRLPVEVVDDKAIFWQLAYNLLQAPQHITSHLEQVQTALAST